MKAEKSGPKVAAIVAGHALRGAMPRLEPVAKAIALRANAEAPPTAKVKDHGPRPVRAAAKAKGAVPIAARPVNAVKPLCHCRKLPCRW